MDIENSIKTEMLSEKIRNSPNNLCISVEVCVVCGDRASGRHYGAISCEGCKGFFKRSIRKQLGYQCRGNKNCEVTKHHRNRCQYCRLQKCLASGMRSDSVQHERKPIIDKKEYTNNIGNNFNSNSVTKIFIRKDLNMDSAGYLPTSFNPCDSITLPFMSKRIVNSSTSQDVQYHLSPNRVSPEDDASLDSINAGGGEMADSLMMARDKQIISKALENVARAQCISDADLVQLPDENCYDYEAPIFQEQYVKFNLQAPAPVPNYLNMHYICEIGSRLLFTTVQWIRNVPAVQYLPVDAQTCIFQGCWAELFTLGLAQCSHSLNLPLIQSALTGHLQLMVTQDKVLASKIKQVADHIVKLQEYVISMNRLNVDDQEYAYLRILTLFSIDRLNILLHKHIERMQERAMHALRTYVAASYPNDPDRFARLLLRLPPLRALEPIILEELFFSTIIGQMEIDSIIPYIVSLGAGGKSTPNSRHVKSEQIDEFPCQ